ncbi:exonuclease domain-containing protein [Alkalimonas collagenimarina]|uniref:Exonuclease domain-containing protein n=1 Tax=Alkalimonas collagenimarina TaxID=400390 RepID=A0ABT9H1P0_9GAMM|nr:exonuclease domain-containing protein [Alkalimonas collagenimarina]MDP4537232.1 exonuclease domain-containing protein [Alkalimonas collagenimarina]
MFGWFKNPPMPMNDIVRQYEAISPPSPKTKLRDVNFLALDLELTGLDAKQDHIVSAGWVPIRQQEIILGESAHYLVKSPIGVGQSAVFHGVHDHQLLQGMELCELLQLLLESYPGYILVAHHAVMDLAFLTMACQRCFGRSPKFNAIDTMRVEWQRLQRKGTVLTQNALRLPNCLERHHLPEAPQHHALADAFACAQLLISQIRQYSNAEMTLAELQALSR